MKKRAWRLPIPTPRRPTGLALALAATGLLTVTPAARADIIAAADVAAPAPRTDVDIALIDLSLGTRVALPVSVNTAADEISPSLTPDGRRLVFERLDRATGTVRIVLVDLSSGQAADLFTGSETASSPPSGAAITPDGSRVATGIAVSNRTPQLTLTDVAAFPGGPFPHNLLQVQNPLDPTLGQPGSTAQPAGGGNNLVAFAWPGPVPLSLLQSLLFLVDRSEPIIGTFVQRTFFSFGHPALAAGINPQFLFFDARLMSADTFGQGDNYFGPPPSGAGRPSRLPALVDSGLDESQPAVTPNGRYLAFVRHGLDGHDRLLVWDSQTQLIVNGSGADLGAVTTRDRGGGVSAYERPVLAFSSISASGILSAQLLQNAGVGILVQRVRGFRTLLGRRRPVLRLVGRVPFGPKRAGRVQARWDGRVGGRRLPAGLYQVTPRALGPGGRVRDLARPILVRLRADGTIAPVAPG